jgi:L-fuculose-phosphate aldolase
LDKAYTRSLYLEWVCRLYHQACQIGEPVLLTPEQLEDVAQALGTYGQVVKKEA